MRPYLTVDNEGSAPTHSSPQQSAAAAEGSDPTHRPQLAAAQRSSRRRLRHTAQRVEGAMRRRRKRVEEHNIAQRSIATTTRRGTMGVARKDNEHPQLSGNCR